MKENKLIVISMEFAVDIVNTCKVIRGAYSLCDQLLRSGTSIGANIREANYAHSKADFVSKLQIALKECYETEYWLELFTKSNVITPETSKTLMDRCGNIRRLLVASINTAKGDK